MYVGTRASAQTPKNAPMPLINVHLLQSQRRSPSLSVTPTDGAARTPSPSRRVSYKTTRPSPPPQQPRRHLSPVNNIDVVPLIQRSNAPSLHTSPSADASRKGTRTPGEAHARHSPGTQVHVTLNRCLYPSLHPCMWAPEPLPQKMNRCHSSMSCYCNHSVDLPPTPLC